MCGNVMVKAVTAQESDYGRFLVIGIRRVLQDGDRSRRFAPWREDWDGCDDLELGNVSQPCASNYADAYLSYASRVSAR